MKRILPCLLLLGGFLLFLPAPEPISAETFTCLACHSAMQGKVRGEGGLLVEVNIDAGRYAKSAHGGFDCLMCHKRFHSNPHEPAKAEVPKDIAALADQIAVKAKVDPVALASCSECHGEAYKSWQNSVHGGNVINKKQPDGASCLDCHGSPHYIALKSAAASQVHRNNIVKTCGGCHEKEAMAKKYNLGPHILDRYYESFHGKKYIIGHLKAPTCVNCHSAHDVKKWDDPKSPVAWANRTETCGKCHAGATKEFVAAITHKPIGKGNPIPYYAEKGLIVLTLGTFAFIIGHVILEAFAEIRDRLLRKGKEGRHE